MRSLTRGVVPLLALGLAVPVAAHHRKVPPAVAITTSGDATLPRLPSPSKKTLIFRRPDGAILTYMPFRRRDQLLEVAPPGDNANPTVSVSGRAAAWDTSETPPAWNLPGRQVVASLNGVLFPVSSDPTGTSANPAIDPFGSAVAFESNGNLSGDNPAGARQIFLWRILGAPLRLSSGVGESRNPGISAKGRRIVWQSTSHPGSGADTGVPQIWTTTLDAPAPAPITDGAAGSTDPVLADDGYVVVFLSRADLAHTRGGAPFAAPQVFAYHLRSATVAQVTNEPGGCETATVLRVKHDYRIGYTCGGEAFLYMLRSDARAEIETWGGETTRVLPQLGAHFVSVATAGNLTAGGGTTAPDHRLYFVNVFARAPVPVGAAPAVWYPTRGL